MREIDSSSHYGTFEPKPNEKSIDNNNPSLYATIRLNRQPNESSLSTFNWPLWKNVTWFCLAWLLYTLGSSVVYFMESTIYDHDGLGVVSLAISMIASAIGCYVTEPIMSKIGCRWTLIVNGLGNVVFYLANLYANWYTLVTASAIDGFTTGLGTVASYAFIAHAANSHAAQTNSDLDRIQSRVSVVYLVFCNAGVIIGNALSPIILSVSGSSRISTKPNSNLVNQTIESLMNKCGYEHHFTSSISPFTNNDYNVYSDFLFQPEIDYLQLVELMELCLGTTLIAIFIFMFLVNTRDMDKEGKLSSHKNHNASYDEFDSFEKKSTVPFVFNDYRIFLLIPTALVVIGGSSFWAADFAKCFVACSVGLDLLGYVTLWSGVGGTLSGVIFGWFNTKKFRVIPLLVAPLSQMAVLVFLLYWTPTKGSLLFLCVLTVSWYLGVGVRNALFPALIAVVCPDILKSAYATLYTMTFVGSTLVFLWSNWLKMDIKIFIMLAMFAASFIGYVILEITLYTKRLRPSAAPTTVYIDQNDNPAEVVADSNLTNSNG
ncbi:unc-93 [Chamberlinius hualienensis]